MRISERAVAVSAVMAAVIAVLGAAAVVSPAAAHFLMLYTSSATRLPGSTLDLLVAFAHPFPGAPMMAMEKPTAFYVVRQRGNEGKVEKVDLSKYLEPIDFLGTDEKTAPAFKVTVPKTEFRSSGDYVFVVEPVPFFEETEDKYIQQYTKLIVNVGGIPGNWDKDVRLPAEIRPLDKPYALWAGGIFRGMVLSAGKPVPNAEIEVQYVNRDPDLATKAWGGAPKVTLPHPAFETLTIRSDPNGVFAIGLPRAGWWGIAALAVGPAVTHKGKKLSQDAVLWIQAADIR